MHKPGFILGFGFTGTLLTKAFELVHPYLSDAVAVATIIGVIFSAWSSYRSAKLKAAQEQLTELKICDECSHGTPPVVCPICKTPHDCPLRNKPANTSPPPNVTPETLGDDDD